MYTMWINYSILSSLPYVWMSMTGSYKEFKIWKSNYCWCFCCCCTGFCPYLARNWWPLLSPVIKNRFKNMWWRYQEAHLSFYPFVDALQRASPAPRLWDTWGRGHSWRGWRPVWKQGCKAGGPAPSSHSGPGRWPRAREELCPCSNMTQGLRSSVPPKLLLATSWRPRQLSRSMFPPWMSLL